MSKQNEENLATGNLKEAHESDELLRLLEEYEPPSRHNVTLNSAESSSGVQLSANPTTKGKDTSLPSKSGEDSAGSPGDGSTEYIPNCQGQFQDNTWQERNESGQEASMRIYNQQQQYARDRNQQDYYSTFIAKSPRVEQLQQASPYYNPWQQQNPLSNPQYNPQPIAEHNGPYNFNYYNYQSYPDLIYNHNGFQRLGSSNYPNVAPEMQVNNFRGSPSQPSRYQHSIAQQRRIDTYNYQTGAQVAYETPDEEVDRLLSQSGYHEVNHDGHPRNVFANNQNLLKDADVSCQVNRGYSATQAACNRQMHGFNSPVPRHPIQPKIQYTSATGCIHTPQQSSLSSNINSNKPTCSIANPMPSFSFVFGRIPIPASLKKLSNKPTEERTALATPTITVSPEEAKFKTTKKRCADLRPKQFDLELLQVGNFNLRLPSDEKRRFITKLKVIFAMKRLIYEFPFPLDAMATDTAPLSTRHYAVTVSFESIVSLDIDGKMITMVLNQQPEIISSDQGHNSGIHPKISFNQSANHLDPSLEEFCSTLTHKFVLRGPQTERFWKCLIEFDANFREKISVEPKEPEDVRSAPAFNGLEIFKPDDIGANEIVSSHGTQESSSYEQLCLDSGAPAKKRKTKKDDKEEIVEVTLE